MQRNTITIIVILLMLIFLVGCEKEENTKGTKGQFTVNVIEVYEDEDGVYIVKKTANYAVGGIWLLYTEDFEYKLGDEVVVTLVSDNICVPFVEYIDNTIDGYKYKLGEGWVKK